MLCGVGLRFNPGGEELLEGVSDKRSPEDRELLVGVQAAEAFSRFHHSSGGPAQRHRSISPSLQPICEQTRRTLPIMFSIELVQASERRRSFAGTPRLKFVIRAGFIWDSRLHICGPGR